MQVLYRLDPGRRLARTVWKRHIIILDGTFNGGENIALRLPAFV